MAKPELGTKRLCGNCSAKFYDLNKTPIVCPKCHTVMELVGGRGPSHGRNRCACAGAAAPVAAEETLVPETQEAEFVSLEEADAEAEGKKGRMPKRSRAPKTTSRSTRRSTMPP